MGAGAAVVEAAIMREGATRRSMASNMTETPLASVFAQGRYVGAILSRGVRGFEAIDEDNASHGFFNSQREAAAALQMALRATGTN